MFLFTSFHCNCHIFNAANLIPSVEFETIHHCEWRGHLTPEKAGHTSQKAVNNPSRWSGCCRRAAQAEECGKSSGRNYRCSESRRDTPRKLIPADPSRRSHDASSRCCGSLAHKLTDSSLSPSFTVTKTPVPHKHTPPTRLRGVGKKEEREWYAWKKGNVIVPIWTRQIDRQTDRLIG